MDEMFGHENSLFGTRGLPVGHPDRSSKSFDYYNKKFGPMIVRVIKNNDLQESIRRILREEIEFNYGQDLFDYHKKENLPYHSKYKRGESIDYYKKHFIDEVKKHIVEDNQILLYRVVATKKEKDIKKPFGTYWAFKKEDSQVIDWENIKDTDDLKLFRITALFNLSDINWKDSFDLYLMNDFMESEIRVNYGANPEEYFIDEL
jgi:methyl coenzyme M reductase subunit D